MSGPTLAFQSELAAAHRDGRHGMDPSGYWRQTGCPLCLPEGLLRDASDFELVRRVDFQSIAATVWVLREVKSRGIWTVGTFGNNPAADYAVSPWGDFLDGGYNPRRAPLNVPAGIWHLLADELNKKEVVE